MPTPTPTPMLAIKGTYRIISTRPDGDTVSFLPQDPGFWCDVPGRNRVERNSRGGGTVRMDAIDALETHYKGVGPEEVHQPLNLGARAARDELLSWLGFHNILMDEREKVIASTPETVPGFVLASGADMFGRCIALVGRGDLPPGVKNGKRTIVTTDHLRQTANHRLLELGLVYPTFYSKLPDELREDMAETTRRARAAKVPNSVWANDVTFEDGAKIKDLTSITAHQVILPKLFRRLADYIRLFGPSLTCFPAYLAGEHEEFRLAGQEGSVHGLQHVIEIIDDTIRMTRPIEDITIVEK
ncbi:nuclease [Streptomyces europaeiscabiei]|uniref:nuclease n=1 Tax=Streptomyces europaeiscabiei TaxID=146819 RepID=UPI002E28B812|nr:nuclease [Streptomyces europaeiscabiei]